MDMKQGKGCGSMPQEKQEQAQPAKGGHEKVSPHVRSQAQHHASTARKGGGK